MVMATKMVCDRCGADVTGITGAVTVAWDVNNDHSFEGDPDYDHDLCLACYRNFSDMYERWIKNETMKPNE